MPKGTLFLLQCVENFSFLCMVSLNSNPFYSSICSITIPSVVCHDFFFLSLLSVNHCSPWTIICSLFSDSNVLTCEQGERLCVMVAVLINNLPRVKADNQGFTEAISSLCFQRCLKNVSEILFLATSLCIWSMFLLAVLHAWCYVRWHIMPKLYLNNSQVFLKRSVISFWASVKQIAPNKATGAHKERLRCLEWDLLVFWSERALVECLSTFLLSLSCLLLQSLCFL